MLLNSIKENEDVVLVEPLPLLANLFVAAHKPTLAWEFPVSSWELSTQHCCLLIILAFAPTIHRCLSGPQPSEPVRPAKSAVKKKAGAVATMSATDEPLVVEKAADPSVLVMPDLSAFAP